MDETKFSAAWQLLKEHSQQIADLRIKEQFALDSQRFSRFAVNAAGIFLDYSKNRVTQETMRLLLALAEAAEVVKYRDKMFGGKSINITENRAVLHSALRDLQQDEFLPEIKLVKKELKRIAERVDNVRSGRWRGYSGKVITDLVNIGIGGSDLGPAMVVAALQPYVTQVKVHFVSNLDATHISETLKHLNPETTLFVIASKTFVTQETLTNAITAKEWLLSNATTSKNAIKQHFIGVTAVAEKAIAFGIDRENIFPIWDWVGGRFSLWSAIGIAIAFAIGMERFYELLNGAHQMDEHFKQAPLEENLPVIMALLSIWNINFLDAATQAVIPYDQYLSLFPAYLQQLEMESNGKHVNLTGKIINYKTAPVIWGGVGTNSQHSFHQLLMQGTQVVPVDFILPLHTHNPIDNHHLLLYANCLAQSRALMCGATAAEVMAELAATGVPLDVSSKLVPHKVISGNIPSNTIVIDKIEPLTLGALLALYEHKVFVEGVVWQINSFDQWGVELGKKIANKLVPMLQGDGELSGLDGSTLGLIKLKSKVG